MLLALAEIKDDEAIEYTIPDGAQSICVITAIRQLAQRHNISISIKTDKLNHKIYLTKI